MKRDVFVNVYELSTHYGGPEEGGWEYQSGSPVLTKATTCICDGLEYGGTGALGGILYGQHGELCPAGHWLKALRSTYSGPSGFSFKRSLSLTSSPFALWLLIRKAPASLKVNPLAPNIRSTA